MCEAIAVWAARQPAVEDHALDRPDRVGDERPVHSGSKCG